jgi:D-xylose transport system permease protein
MMNATENPTVTPDQSFWNRLSLRFDVRAYTMIIALIGIWLLFSILTDWKFIMPRNLSNLSRQMCITAVLAIGMVMVIVATHIDLSVGSVLGMTAGLAAVLQVWYRWPTIPVILVTLSLGAIIGLWHGYWVAYQKVPAFIVTLAGLGAYRGVVLWVLKGATVSHMNLDFEPIMGGYLGLIPGLILTAIFMVALIYGRLRSRQSKLKYGFEVRPWWLELSTIAFFCVLIGVAIWIFYQYDGIPYPIILVLLMVLIFTFITNNTQFGRQVYAMGGNIEAARLSGINIKARTVVVFVLASTMAAVAGIFYASRLDAATITAGQSAELDAIAACVIGGTSLAGGVGTIPGAIIGALVMASVDNGMSMMNMDACYQMMVKGLILLLAVWLDMRTKK